MATRKNAAMKVTSLDSHTARLLQQDMNEALHAVALKYGVKITAHGGSLPHPTEFIAKFKVNVVDAATGEAHTAEARNFKNYAAVFGLKASDLGREFMLNGKKFKLTGIMPNRPKFPILAVDAQGKRFKLTEDTVRAALK